MNGMPAPLTNPQKKYLRGLAHRVQATIQVGKLGLTPSFYKSLETALNSHELLKLRFTNLKEERHELSAEIAATTKAELVSLVGHTAIYFRPNADTEKRKVVLPRAKRTKLDELVVSPKDSGKHKRASR